MIESNGNFEAFLKDVEKTKEYFLTNIQNLSSPIHIYTHIDADGLSAGAILGKALFRKKLPFQITVLRQLEREEIQKIALNQYSNFMIFSDFGSGQYLELQKTLLLLGYKGKFLILDHHLPQKISNKKQVEELENIHIETSPWHINPYFYKIDGSNEISSSGICYYFAKKLNENNNDLSPIALVGAVGDIQNQGPNKSFLGLNSLILKEAINSRLIEMFDDLNFSTIKPLNEAIAYSNDLKLSGLTNDPNKTLKFLQTIGIFMENSDGTIKTLNDLNKDEKQKISSAIIEYSSFKLEMEPNEIIEKLIANRYLLLNEGKLELRDAEDFSNLLNACGRTESSSLGIAIAMGDRENAYQQAKEILVNYKKTLMNSLSWIKENNKIQKKKNIQFFFGEDIIPENVIGTISSMLIFDNTGIIDKNMPIFGCAKRKDEDVYKISGRAHEIIINKGVNLSEAIRKALELSNLDSLGGGHPPAAGTKVPTNKIELFLENLDNVIKNQLKI
jgi:single-stranded-DNA-specific exonuclease